MCTNSGVEKSPVLSLGDVLMWARICAAPATSSVSRTARFARRSEEHRTCVDVLIDAHRLLSSLLHRGEAESVVRGFAPVDWALRAGDHAVR
jgi:hypothetical protein